MNDSLRCLLLRLASYTLISLGALTYFVFKPNWFKRWKLVGVVKELWIYPVASCKGVSMKEIICNGGGIEKGAYRDREFMIVFDDNERHFKQYHSPKMSNISAVCHGRYLRLTAPAMEVIDFPVVAPTSVRFSLNWTVKNDYTNISKTITSSVGNKSFSNSCGQIEEAVDCGKQVSKWLCAYFGNESIHLYRRNDVTSWRSKTSLERPSVEGEKLEVGTDLDAEYQLHQASLSAERNRLKMHLPNNAGVVGAQNKTNDSKKEKILNIVLPSPFNIWKLKGDNIEKENKMKKQRASPTKQESVSPTMQKSASPTKKASAFLTKHASAFLAKRASALLPKQASASPTKQTSALPTNNASASPTKPASALPTKNASASPTKQASAIPSKQASVPPKGNGKGFLWNAKKNKSKNNPVSPPVVYGKGRGRGVPFVSGVVMGGGIVGVSVHNNGNNGDGGGSRGRDRGGGRDGRGGSSRRVSGGGGQAGAGASGTSASLTNDTSKQDNPKTVVNKGGRSDVQLQTAVTDNSEGRGAKQIDFGNQVTDIVSIDESSDDEQMYDEEMDIDKAFNKTENSDYKQLLEEYLEDESNEISISDPVSVASSQTPRLGMITVYSRSSMEEVNRIFEMHPMMDGHDFRANIVIDGCEEFAELGWSMLKIGAVTLRVHGADRRCLRPAYCDVDDTFRGEPEKLPQLTDKIVIPGSSPIPLLGLKTTVDSEGLVKVGDQVYIIEANKPYS